MNVYFISRISSQSMKSIFIWWPSVEKWLLVTMVFYIEIADNFLFHLFNFPIINSNFTCPRFPKISKVKIPTSKLFQEGFQVSKFIQNRCPTSNLFSKLASNFQFFSKSASNFQLFINSASNFQLFSKSASNFQL